MGMALGNGNGRRRRPVSEINVTPLVDVMLVLLVIFMITAPMLKDGIDVDLPRAKGGKSGGVASAPLAVVVDASGRVHVGSTLVETTEIDAKLPPLLKGHEKDTVALKAHKGLPWSSVARVIGVMQAAGIRGVSIAVERQ